MTFINERITEEDKQKYKIYDISDYQKRQWNVWTIDRDRDCFLIYNGMSHDLPWCYYFIFSYQGNITKIDVEVKPKGKSPEGVNLTHYDICYLQIPDRINHKRDEILDLFSEAIDIKESGKNVNEKVTVVYNNKKLGVS